MLGLKFAPNEPLLAASTGLDTVVWDLTSGTPELVRQGRVSAGTAFTPGGELVTSTQAGTLALRDARTVKPLVEVETCPRPCPTLDVVAGPLGGPHFADIHPDGGTVVLGGQTTSVLTLDPDRWDEAACRTAARDLTRDEWDRYFPGEPYRRTCADLLAAAGSDISG